MNTILALHDPGTARSYYERGLWRDDTLYTLLAGHAQTRGNAYAVRDAARRITWTQLKNWVDALSAELHGLGVKRGQRVSIWLPNRIETLVIFLACSRNGYVCNPSLHQSHTTDEIVLLLERIQSVVLFAQPGFGADKKDSAKLDKADIFSAVRTLAGLKRIYKLDAQTHRDNNATSAAADKSDTAAAIDHSARFPSMSAAMNAVDAAALPAVDSNPDKIVYLAFTSGTTGMPKGVLHSDNTLLANGRGMVKDWHLKPESVIYSISPLSHHIATVGIEQSLMAGCELVINDVPQGKHIVDWIIATQATYVMGVPTHAMDILTVMKQRALKGLGAVTMFYMAGSTIPKETAQAFLDYGIKPQNVYGMTENGSHQYTLPDDGVTAITTTCGKACSGYETRLWDQENPDIEVAAGQIGEIGTRGPLLMLGYFNNQSATENSFNAGGWFLSGDLGRFDEQGNLQIVGRKKDIIIRGGHNIFPARIENLAMRHKVVLKAAAYPVADQRLGERVCLAVILRAGEQLAGDEMLKHLDVEGLSKYDMPEYYIAMDAFPLTPSGKILKRELVEWTSGGRIAPSPVRWNG